ncbi:MAG: hypothetical protein WCC14_01665 [Acidobacteriaceae bacterium]
MRFVTAARRPRRLSVGRFAALLGIVCIALVLFTGIVQVTHHHADGRLDPDCALCMTAHTVAQVVVVVVVQITSQPVEHYVAEAVPAPKLCPQFAFKLAKRPPPVPPVFA